MTTTDRPTPTDELLREKNLWQMYLATWRARFPLVALVPSLLGSFAIVAYHVSASPPLAQITQQVRSLSEFGFQLSVAMLGFLVAGFTIFATITKPTLFRRMLETEHPETGYSWLKWTFLLFMHVFSHFVGFLFLVLTIRIFGSEGGALSYFIGRISAEGCALKPLIASGALVVLVWWTTYLLVLLGQFIYNVYQICAVIVIAEVENL